MSKHPKLWGVRTLRGDLIAVDSKERGKKIVDWLNDLRQHTLPEAPRARLEAWPFSREEHLELLREAHRDTATKEPEL
ncbi:hypothetical protein [Actinopolyspora halophila]|uniref:hypothetical protein n=1 Tax=Actinopolyspora halophila TaxID=1850 RepID=UPI000373941F|nr:hypothetical protein [Actinopolyspora halophila]